MPTYGYMCTSCSHHTEMVQGINEKPLQLCERCGGKLRRVYRPAGVHFKGSGFYSTDARMADYKRSKGPPKPNGQGASKEKPAAASSKPSEPGL